METKGDLPPCYFRTAAKSKYLFQCIKKHKKIIKKYLFLYVPGAILACYNSHNV